jgi:DNA-binding NtrC family response regulator
MKPNIMFVDDSISVREALQLLFKDEPYNLFAFDSPHDALSVIKSLEWAVFVADQTMQRMDGLEFLERVRIISPYTMGIIMTNDNEIKENLEVLYSGNDYRFVKKPLDSDEIRQAVKEAIAQYEINTLSKEHEVYE